LGDLLSRVASCMTWHVVVLEFQDLLRDRKSFFLVLILIFRYSISQQQHVLDEQASIGFTNNSKQQQLVEGVER